MPQMHAGIPSSLRCHDTLILSSLSWFNPLSLFHLHFFLIILYFCSISFLLSLYTGRHIMWPNLESDYAILRKMPSLTLPFADFSIASVWKCNTISYCRRSTVWSCELTVARTRRLKPWSKLSLLETNLTWFDLINQMNSNCLRNATLIYSWPKSTFSWYNEI